MRKNVAGQAIGAQMITAADGSAFTGSVTVSVTGDAGTQATGSVGAGACTHEGNGYHTYAPAQAETNYDLVAFTFTGSGAIPVTVQVYTTTPQTGDAYAVVNDGTSGNAALKTLIDAVDDFVDTEVGTIISALATAQADLDTITGAAGVLIDTGTGAGQLNISSGLLAWNAAWDAEVQSEVTDALNAYDPPTNAEMEARTLAAASYATAANQATIAGYIDTEIGTIITHLTDIKGATFDGSTDSLEAIRNRGDSAWVTATGFSTFNPATDTVANVTTVGSVTTKTGYALTADYDFAKGTVAMTEAYAANGAAPTAIQALYAIQQYLTTFAISGTAYSVKKLDGTTEAFEVTLDDATTPTAATRTP